MEGRKKNLSSESFQFHELSARRALKNRFSTLTSLETPPKCSFPNSLHLGPLGTSQKTKDKLLCLALFWNKDVSHSCIKNELKYMRGRVSGGSVHRGRHVCVLEQRLTSAVQCNAMQYNDTSVCNKKQGQLVWANPMCYHCSV